MIALHILTRIIMAERGALGALIVRKISSLRKPLPSFDLDQTWSHEPKAES